jgi:hypothetical protein
VNAGYLRSQLRLSIDDTRALIDRLTDEGVLGKPRESRSREIGAGYHRDGAASRRRSNRASARRGVAR